MTEYLDTFARFRRKETIEEIDELLRAHAVFDPFEKSQLASLCCENHEEAKTLIPSIANKISDADLQELLDEISKRRNFLES
jgi:DNA-directed RNA polymerase II subunit RPB4